MREFFKRHGWVIFLALTSMSLSVVAISRSVPMQWQYAIAPIIQSGSEPSFQTIFDYSYQKGTAHAPAIRILPNGFSVMWYQGSREGASDVAIMQSSFVQAKDTWQSGPPHVLLNAPMLQAVSVPHQAITKLGNIVQYGVRPDHLLMTVVSIGGWAAASIADITLKNGVAIRAEKLNLSPFLNRSHLVKTPMFRFTDGDSVLPAYFEMGNSFGVQVRLGPDGRVRDKSRITGGRLGIQPMIVPLNDKKAVALLRNFNRSRHLVASWTQDGGQNWSPPELLDIPNPGEPVAALPLANGDILMAFNDDKVRSDLLRLAVSSDAGRSWRRIATLEDHQGDRRSETAYAMMRRLPSGEIVLVYSTNYSKGIKAHIFNDSWVLSQ